MRARRSPASPVKRDRAAPDRGAGAPFAPAAAWARARRAPPRAAPRRAAAARRSAVRLPACHLNGPSPFPVAEIGAGRFELPASRPQTGRSDQAELRPARTQCKSALLGVDESAQLGELLAAQLVTL